MASARRLRIIERSPARAPLDVADREDFAAVETEAELSPDEALRTEGLSLYCLDAQAREAVFTAVPGALDLQDMAFAYQAQFEHATHLVTLPWDELVRLADARRSTLTAPVFVYSTGRAGSTLVSRLLAQVDGVLSVSEPDALTQLAWMRSAGMITPAELLRLVRGVVVLCCPGLGGRRLVLKTRSQVFGLYDVLSAEFLDGATVFAYRSARAVVDSYLRALPSHAHGLTQRIARVRWVKSLDSALDSVEEATLVRLGRAGHLVGHWLAAVTRYLAVAEHDPRSFALRYESLMADPRGQLERLLQRLALPAVEPRAFEQVLATESQEGTTLAQSNRDEQQALTEAEWRAIAEFLASWPQLEAGEAILPGTLGHPSAG